MVLKQVPWNRSLKVWVQVQAPPALEKFLHFCFLIYKMGILFSALLTSQDCFETQMRQSALKHFTDYNLPCFSQNKT